MSNPVRLLDLLHRVFDKKPYGFLALRVGADGTGLTWSVAGDTLTLTPTGGTAQPLIIDLNAYTVTALGVYIAGQPGYSVFDLDASQKASLSATLLIDGSGDVSVSGGDRLFAYTNPLWSFLTAIKRELSAASDQIVEMIRQMVMTDSEGEWSDYWGEYYGVPRKSGEDDSAYTARIVIEVLRPRANAVALKSILEDSLGGTFVIREPWREIFALSVSALSGTDHLQNRDFWNYNVIEVQMEAGRGAVEPLVTRNKAAGVWVWYRRFFRHSVTVAEPTTTFDFRAKLTAIGDVTDAPTMAGFEHAAAHEQYLSGIVGGYIDAGGARVDDVYEIDGTWYDGRITNTDLGVSIYQLHAPGAGAITTPLLAGDNWPATKLTGAGYLAGHTVADLTQLSFKDGDSIQLEATQEPFP